MRGKWAAGIPPRNFTWIIQDHLAVSERPGGSAPNHRRVRRQEEIIWLRVQGFNRVVSLLPSPHNLAAYDEGEVAWSHFPLAPGVETSEVLTDLYFHLDDWLGAGERILLHQEELGDRVMGVVAGYLLWCKRLPAGPQAIVVTERLVGRQMGPQGRDLVAEVAAILAAPEPPKRKQRAVESAEPEPPSEEVAASEDVGAAETPLDSADADADADVAGAAAATADPVAATADPVTAADRPGAPDGGGEGEATEVGDFIDSFPGAVTDDEVADAGSAEVAGWNPIA